MKLQEIEIALQGMVGKLFSFQKQEHRILRYEIKETNVKIITDVKDIVILMPDISETLDTFDRIHTPNDNAAGVSILKSQTVVGSAGTELKKIIMDSIDNVKKDKGYIPQAQAINDSIKSLIELARTEVEMLKVVSGLNRH